MTGKVIKSFPVFDCDAHINDYLMPWDKYYSEKEKELVKHYYWNYDEYRMINSRVIGWGRPKDRWWIQPWTKNGAGGPLAAFTDFLGPGMNKKIIRKLNHMNLTVEQLGEVAHRGSIEPLPRIKDMDLMGIDQVLVIPIILFWTLPWLENAEAAAAVARAYNNWAKYDYCDAAPDRLFPAGVVALQDPYTAAAELRRAAGLGFRVGSLRPVDALGRYPNQPLYEPLWQAYEETGMVCGVHPNPTGQKQQGQYSPTNVIDRSAGAGRNSRFTGQALSFIYESMTWITGMLMSGFLERHPGLKMAIFESNATWLPMVLESADRMFRLYGSERIAKVEGLPSEVFHRRCLIAFEGDEDWVFRRHQYFKDIGIWSSDTYHGDGADAWEPIEKMQKLEVAEATQAQMMGGNARRFYGLEDRARVYTTTSPDSIPRPAWFPKLEDIEREYARAGEPRAGLP